MHNNTADEPHRTTNVRVEGARSHLCGAIGLSDVGHRATLNGWVARVRNHGGVLFLDVRDRAGVVQAVIAEGGNPELWRLGEGLRNEACVAVEGTVQKRPETMINRSMATGEVEVAVDRLSLLADCEALPFRISDEERAREELRQRYRFLDLRRPTMQRALKMRHLVAWTVREFLHREGFYEIETPTLIRSTPEGARDLLVPARTQPGRFYALPQSPQIYKQLLMSAGFERYFQIARCYRDEDTRGDRQLEHTQIDIEMSFVKSNDIYTTVERMLARIFDAVLARELPLPFPRLTYDDAMLRYGSDKPDIRYGAEIEDCAAWATRCELRFFKQALTDGGVVRLIRVAGHHLTRRDIAALESDAQRAGAGGVAWCCVTEGGFTGGIGKYLTPHFKEIAQYHHAGAGDTLLLIAGRERVVCKALDAVRRALIRAGTVALTARAQGGVERDFGWVWITDFPLFSEADEGGWEPAHHIFSMPHERYHQSLEQRPEAVRGHIYDLVCNGIEVASGSIRIHNPELQRRVLKIIGMGHEEAEERFGVLLRALRYGTPPHGGIAPGLDRLMMILRGESTIREVMAFPKNHLGASALDDSPAEVPEEQLRELGISLLTAHNREP